MPVPSSRPAPAHLLLHQVNRGRSAVTDSPRRERTIAGRYRLIEPLGAGAFGKVWRAHDDALGVDVAVKEVWLPQQAMTDREHRERVTRAAREARNAARLRDHPHVVAVHDVVVEDGTPWIVMRLVKGRSLGERLKADGPMSARQVTEVARGLLKALQAAHAAGVVHRDLKPANVMLTPEGDVLLTDFGIAVHETDTKMTSTGQIIGSAEYLAPERLDGVKDSGAGDLFSLGVSLYEAVEGVSPFRRDTAAATLAAVALCDPPRPRRADPALAGLIMSLLAKDPAERPPVERALAMLRGSERNDATTTRALPEEARLTVRNVTGDDGPLHVFADDVEVGVVGGTESGTFNVPPGVRAIRVGDGRHRSEPCVVQLVSGTPVRLAVRRHGRDLLLGSTPESMTPPASRTAGAPGAGRRIAAGACVVAGIVLVLMVSGEISHWPEWDMPQAIAMAVGGAALSAAFTGTGAALALGNTQGKPLYGRGLAVAGGAFLVFVPLIIVWSGYLGGPGNGPW
ncbi:serine/threonine-protein kinase [Streptomyces sp. SCL15-6]|uniref:serine/threonine-protein kinase n=1 Tax=Streptomyces sp. SCL15-6 TaxID=2967222 RepID=UPI00399002E4